MAALVHLVRHAEVDNPDHVVVGSMTGFGLSPHGFEQARRVGRYLGPRPVVAIWASPFERALRTAEEIAARSSVPVRVDPGLSDWEIVERWKGQRWASVAEMFPGELEQYLNQPAGVTFGDETLDALSERVADVARRLDAEHPHGDVVIVSHQDAIQAGKLRLLGAPMTDLHSDKLGHGAIISMRPGDTWRVETVWEPGESPRFGERSDLRLVPDDEPTQPTSA